LPGLSFKAQLLSKGADRKDTSLHPRGGSRQAPQDRAILARPHFAAATQKDRDSRTCRVWHCDEEAASGRPVRVWTTDNPPHSPV